MRDASERLKETDFDLILLDVGLPDGDGFQFMEFLQSDQGAAGVPVIFVSGMDSVEDRIQGIRLGAEDYLVKPYVPAEFRARIENRLKLRLREAIFRPPLPSRTAVEVGPRLP